MNVLMKLVSAIVIILVALSVLSCQPKAESQKNVIFADTNLEAAVRNALFVEGIRRGDEALSKKPSNEEIMVAELEKLTIVEAIGRNITSLQGLEYCVNLKELYLSDNQLSDISQLSSLKSLTRLDLGANGISDISSLASLDELTILDLYVNQIRDISPLASLASLSKLFLFRNQIGDISPLADLTNLAELDLHSNRINDISPLQKNKGLGEGDFVRLTENELDLAEGSDDVKVIKILEDRGILVIID
jgi:Leucine-rich repeat (LRR) protein